MALQILPVPDASVDRFLATYVFDLLDPGFALRLIAEAHRVIDSWRSALHGQHDPRYEGILTVRILALVFRV